MSDEALPETTEASSEQPLQLENAIAQLPWHEGQPATVGINSVSGTLEVLGRDKPQVEVTGPLPSDRDSVKISGDPTHLSVQVRIAPSMAVFVSRVGSAHIAGHMPTGSTLIHQPGKRAFRTAGVTGHVELHAVSKRLSVTAPFARDLFIKTVSGDIEVSGGDGNLDISTVSGSGHVTLGA